MLDNRDRHPKAPPSRFAPAVLVAGCAVAALVSCRDATGPGSRRVSLAVAAGNTQFALPRAALEFPLQVRVTDADRGGPLEDVVVSWRILAGTGATVAAVSERTDAIGIASAQLTMGPDTGSVRVEASAQRMVGSGAVFHARAVLKPLIESVAPAVAAAATTVTITGRNFSTVADENTVLFDGLRGPTRSATSSVLSVEVPRCVLTRVARLRVTLGAVASDPVTLSTVSGATAAVHLARGQAVVVTDARDLECMAFERNLSGPQFLVVPQNAAQKIGLPMHHELIGITGGSVLALPRLGRPLTRSAASDWEFELRQRERALGGVQPPTGAELAALAAAPPEIGDRRSFNVITRDQGTRRITAEVKAISQRAVLYVDLEAPANGLLAADLQRFGSLFDDPIYSTDVAIFGTPPDIDGDGKIIILFTPAVNALTDRNDSGFIAGYFYGCDLVSQSRCAATNRSEIFYSMVPDPTGQFGAVRAKDIVLRTVPGVLAHELQHMIHFGRRGESLDVLWLAEGLAHSAEDLVGDVLVARGDLLSAAEFKRPNFVRAQFYLRETATTALVAEDAPGSLEQRGAAWLFMKYLMGHYGGTALLGRLTGAAASGVANIVAAIARPWELLLAEFAVALWADSAPELAGVTIDPKLSFAGFDLRAALAGLQGGYSLQPARVGFQDFSRNGPLASGGQDYVFLQATTSPPALNIAMTGLRGSPFTGGTPQLVLLRVR